MGPEPVGVQDVDATVDLGDGALHEAGVLLFYHFEHALLAVAHDAAVAGGVGGDAGEDGELGAGLPMAGQKGA